MQKCQQAGANGSDFDVQEVCSRVFRSKQQEKIAAGEEVRMY